MNDKLTNYVNGVFAPYNGVKSVEELKVELLTDLNEKYRELKAEGKDDAMAFGLTIDSIGDIEQTLQEVANLSRSLERQVLSNFSGASLSKSDFASITAHKGEFKASDLRGSDFAGADLTGSTFIASDMRDTNFTHTNLTDCTFNVLDLSNANFRQSVLVRTSFSKSSLTDATFVDVKMIDVKLTMSELNKTVFENCSFDGVDFEYSDLRGLKLDGQTFVGVKFDKASLNEATFRGATLKNVSFQPTFTLTNKNYRAIKTINFDGAMMDKLTYASLKGLGAELSKVVVI
jgi:uncharacterized protein YjbI with pentapeptide repeats